MESTRQQKFSRMIQKELAELFLKDTKSLFGNTYVSVNTVRMSPDLSVAKIYLSFLDNTDKKAALQKIKVNTKQVRKLLGDKLKNQIRIIPELIFLLDDGVDYAIHINNLISKLDIPPAPTEAEDTDKDKE
ncbi:MAG TPA: 30S ribosome-binding factor RbfA [Cytophagaceae bacterium]|jgi:ribosome-binding factor A|nr:30S ribosome-binding factor RbfA [Cytophagaceae bacterium]